MSKRVAVLGSDLDGMIAALALADRGADVTLIEESGSVGGLSAAIEIAPGYRSSPALDRGRLRGDLLRQLGLAVTELAPAPPLHRVSSNGGLVSALEVDGGSVWTGELASLSGWARRMLQRPSPALDPRDDWKGALTAGWSTRMLGRRKLRKLIRATSISVADWITEFVDDGPDAACLAAPALESAATGPYAMGTGFHALLRAGATGARAAHGLPQLVRRLEQEVVNAGVTIEVGTPIGSIDHDGSGFSVQLESGHSIPCEDIVSSLSPQRTLLELAPQASLPVTFRESVQAFRCRGDVGVVMIALDQSPPAFLATPGAIYQVGWKSLADLESAADGFKYGSTVEQPPLEITIPSLNDPPLAANGGSVVLVHVRCCAASTSGDRLLEIALAGLETLWSQAIDHVVDSLSLNPQTLASRFSLPGGHLEHGEWALDQLLFLRPDRQCSATSTPIPGLFLCGPGSHPGIALNGASGWMAAQRSQRRRK